MNSIPNRIEIVIKYYNMSYNSFAKSLGLANGTGIKTMIDNNRNPQNQTLNKIVNTYPEINMNWLRTGTGQMISNLPESMSGNDDLTVTAKQVINQLDINNLHYTAILDKKMRDDRDYYDNDSNHVKNIASILEGFKTLEEKVQVYALAASDKVVNNLLIQANGLEKKFDSLEKKMDVNATKRAAGVSKVIGQKMDNSNQYWIERAEKKDAYWLKENNEQKDLFLKALNKVLRIEQDLEDIKTFMAANFELDKMNKKKSKQIKKLKPKIK